MIYIADTSSFRMKPALIVYDVAHKRARRLLQGHKSVAAEKVDMAIEGYKIKLLFVPIRVAVDSIVLDLANEYLYFGPLSGTRMYRVPTAALRDESLAAAALGNAVEDYMLETDQRRHHDRSREQHLPDRDRGPRDHGPEATRHRPDGRRRHGL